MTGIDDGSAFAELHSYLQLRRTASLALSPDGARLVAVVQEPDDECSRYVSAMWEIPLDGGEPFRLTRSAKGEATPVFLPDGRLLFTSTRPAAPGAAVGPAGSASDGDAAVWALPAAGEPTVLAHHPGGLSGPVVASVNGAVVVAGSVLAGLWAGEPDTGDRSTAGEAGRRATRKDRGISAILHTGMPIRYWDHELGDTSPRLFLLAADTDAVRDLAPDAGRALTNAEYSITADGSTVATTWRTAAPRGRFPHGIALIDAVTGHRTVLAADPTVDYTGPRISPDGRQVAVLRVPETTYEVPWTHSLRLVDRAGGQLEIPLGDLHPNEWVWSPDSSTLFVGGDLFGRGAVVAVDAPSATVTHRLVSDAVYSELHVAADGARLVALRSAYDCAPRPVVLDPSGTDQQAQPLPDPAPMPPLPGRLEQVTATHDGSVVHAWLCTPTGQATPAPVMTWIHGGPFLSANSWSWRWNPWVAVAHGWAVLLPDPALSTGYGTSSIERAWPYLADVVWAEVQAVLDAVLKRPDLDGSRLALLGGSFGGYMANWIAGHTDRFAAIVTHAGLWAADQQHATTDGAAFKTGLFGRPADHPDWYEAYSPHRSLDRIRTPMLISHGNRDYRVPVSESLRLWWDLVESWPGDPADLPHRFLQFTGENHWILSPGNAEIWWHSVLGFCAEHVLGQPWTPSPLLTGEARP